MMQFSELLRRVSRVSASERSSYALSKQKSDALKNHGANQTFAKIQSVSDTCGEYRKVGFSTAMMRMNDTSDTRIQFSIRGNTTSPNGNAMPKVKLTKGQQWTPKAKLYAAWKGYVVSQLLDQKRGTKWEAMIIRNIGLHGKPFRTSIDMRATMQLTIHWGDNKHGDPENIFGSIADALFSQDKYLDGSFRSAVSRDGCGRVDVVITLQNQP